MILKLNYKVAYDFLISSCKSRGLNKKSLPFKTHKHHIIPRCIGGLDHEDNYVLLTVNEHKNAHHLLTLMYPENNSLKYAYNLMHSKRWNECFIISKETRVKIGLASKGRTFTDEHKDKIRKANIGNTNSLGFIHSTLSKSRMSKSRIGMKLSDETKLKMSLIGQGKLKSTETKLRMSKAQQNNSAEQSISQAYARHCHRIERDEFIFPMM